MYNFINNYNHDDYNDQEFQPGPEYGAMLFDKIIEDLADSMSNISTTAMKEFRITYWKYMFNWRISEYNNRLTMSKSLLDCSRRKLAHIRPDILKAFVFKNVIYNTSGENDYILVVPRALIKLNKPQPTNVVSQVTKNNTDKLDLSDLYKK